MTLFLFYRTHGSFCLAMSGGVWPQLCSLGHEAYCEDSLGMQFRFGGLCHARKGKRGMLWPELLGLALLDFECSAPNLMVVHLGENDLTIRKGKSLILQIRHNL